MKKTIFIFSLLSTSLYFAQGKCPFNFDSKPTNTPTASVQEIPNTGISETKSTSSSTVGTTSFNTNKDW